MINGWVTEHYGRQKECILKFSAATLKRKDHLEDTGINGKKKQCERQSSIFMGLRMSANSGLCNRGAETYQRANYLTRYVSGCAMSALGSSKTLDNTHTTA